MNNCLPQQGFQIKLGGHQGSLPSCCRRAHSVSSASVTRVALEQLRGRFRMRLKHLTLLFVWGVFLASCRNTRVEPAVPGSSLVRGGPFEGKRIHAVLLNGGGNKEQNYRSHLLHLVHVAELLDVAGVPQENVAVFSGDGPDPEPDLAIRGRNESRKHFWLVEGTGALAWLRPPKQYQNTELPPHRVMPATREALATWFENAKSRLKPGDTLFFFVTDHGTKNDQNPENNHIVLWGPQAHLAVEELRVWLAEIDPQVRVVMLMSQCFSGAFARLMWTRTEGNEPAGNVCGFFASTQDRPAYGCYPENLDKNNIGHAFHMFRAWARESSLYRAHDVVLAADDTPDVPVRTSDHYLEFLIRRFADEKGITLEAAADALLEEAWREKGQWEPHLRLLDKIGQAFGMFSARSLAELAERTAALPDVAQQLRNVSRSWRGAWHDANAANWQRFLEQRPEWRARLAALEPQKLTDDERRSLAQELLPALHAYARQQPENWQRLRRLWRSTREAEGASYRMEVRQAALLRMRSVLLRVAGLQYLKSYATPEERRAYASLVRCEDLRLPPRKFPEPGVRTTPPFPEFEEDVARVKAALPAWMGIQFRPVSEDVAKAKELPGGAAAIITVYPDSPAQAAGLEQGDIVLGPPGRPFSEKGQVRSWIMLSAPGEVLELDVLRGSQRRVVQLVAGTYPLRWPSLPGPPKVGSPAPPIDVEPYRGEMSRQLARGRKHLLFFWATWCGACKAALPELQAFAETNGVRVVAITDEPRKQLDRFFENYRGVFPPDVAIDEFRKAFVAYGVSGTPTFVLVDEDGHVSAVHVGYDAKRGLPFEGWTWHR